MYFYNLIIALFNNALNMIEHMSYFQFALIIALESTCFPVMIPIESIIIPMGYFAFQGKKSFILLLISCVSGILIGCLVNYAMSYYLGRPFLYKYAKYMMLKIKTLEKWEEKFLKNSKFIMFIGRCIPIPAVKHIITIPAGLSKMNIVDFVIYNFLGGLTFSLITLILGYIFGNNIILVKSILFTLLVLTSIIATTVLVKKNYHKIKRVRKK